MTTDPRTATHIRHLETDPNIWIATVRADGRPHLVPIWFVYLNNRIYIATQPDSVKVANLTANPNIALALENGSHPTICEGHAVLLTPPLSDDIIHAFKHKYDWTLTTDPDYTTVLAVTPRKWLAW